MRAQRCSDRSRTRGVRRLRRLVVVSVSALVAVSFGTAIGAAVPNAVRSAGCAGTPKAPATLRGGIYANVTVTGVCEVKAGQVVVVGNVVVEGSHGALVAAFARNAHGGGRSGITVHGNLVVQNGASLLLGCFASSFPCLDDPHKKTKPTLDGPDFVDGDLLATNSLGVVVHDTTIVGDIREVGGGGGFETGPGGHCTPTGIFAAFKSPVYSDYEDSTVDGNMSVTGLRSCWLGSLRDKVGGSVTYLNDKMADPDSMEIETDHVQGNMICAGNSPANQIGDSHGKSSDVGGFATGQCGFGVRKPDPAPVPGAQGNPAGPLVHLTVPANAHHGYDLGATNGGVSAFGTPFFGSAASATPYVGIAAAPGGHGYWLANSDGQVSPFGPNSESFGSVSSSNAPVVGIAAASSGDGYWEATADGGVFGFGPTASFYGSASGVHLAKPIVGIAAAPTGTGYDLVAADGGVFTYGPGAHFHGSASNIALNQPIVAIAIDPSTGGYWLVAADGGVFSFHAPYYGSAAAMHLNARIVGIAAAPTGHGYYLVAANGDVYTFGPAAHYQGSQTNTNPATPVDGIALG